jgi:hypothetical protein
MVDIKDWLFRLGLYWGIWVETPGYLLINGSLLDGQLTQSRMLSLDENHEMTAWLMECDGPWKIKVRQTRQTIHTFIAFARVEDAVAFRLML